MNLKSRKMTFSHQQFLKHYKHRRNTNKSNSTQNFRTIPSEAKMTLKETEKMQKLKNKIDTLENIKLTF